MNDLIQPNGKCKTVHGSKILALLDDSVLESAQDIENFISTSLLSKFYKAVPYSMLHLDIYNIYSDNDPELHPFISKWLCDTGNVLDKSSWVNENIFKEQNAKCEGLFNDISIMIEDITFINDNEKLYVKLTFDKKTEDTLYILRSKLEKLYLKKENQFEFAMILGYCYKKPAINLNPELAQLNLLCRKLTSCKFKPIDIYLYDNILQYIRQDFFFKG